MNCPVPRSPQRCGHTLFAAWLCVLAAVAGGCSGGGGGDSASPPGPQAAADDDFLLTMTAALSEGQLTLNNRWTQADLDFENISAAISYEGLNQPAGRVRPYTILVQEYRARRKQCEEDFNEFYPVTVYTVPIVNGSTYTIQDRKCYPTLRDRPYYFDGPSPGVVADKVLHRYGYYSGGGFPPVHPPEPPNTPLSQSRFRDGTPEPLDPVDYCSRLHDEKVWAGEADLEYGNECGILMCLYKASGMPANVMALLPDVETARQFWYDGAANNVLFIGACKGNQSDSAPPPILGP